MQRTDERTDILNNVMYGSLTAIVAAFFFLDHWFMALVSAGLFFGTWAAYHPERFLVEYRLVRYVWLRLAKKARAAGHFARAFGGVVASDVRARLTERKMPSGPVRSLSPLRR